jgi:hypothetical protein
MSSDNEATKAAQEIHELREEGNIELSASPELHGIFFDDHISRRDHIAVFVIKDFRQITQPTPNYEIIAHGVFTIDELPNDTTAPQREPESRKCLTERRFPSAGNVDQYVNKCRAVGGRGLLTGALVAGRVQEELVPAV